jgi:hypothetical protein
MTKVPTFAEWLQQRDPQLFEETKRAGIIPALVGTGLMGLAGATGWFMNQANKTDVPPPQPKAGIQYVMPSQQRQAPGGMETKAAATARAEKALQDKRAVIDDDDAAPAPAVVKGKAGGKLGGPGGMETKAAATARAEKALQIRGP